MKTNNKSKLNKRMKTAVLMICIFTTSVISLMAQQSNDCLSPQITTGFEQMAKIERLPLLYPYGIKKNRYISYDASGGNGFGLFQSTFTKYVDDKGDLVIFDAYGPGCLYRQQMNIWGGRWGFGSMSKTIHIKYYFDDEQDPRINAPVADFFEGNYDAINAPFTFKDRNQFAISYYPFPFNKRLKVALSDTCIERLLKENWNNGCNWYQYDFLTYPAGAEVKSWEPDSQDAYKEKVASQWLNLGDDPKSTSSNKTFENTISIKAGNQAVIYNEKGEASIASIVLKMEPFTEETFYNTYIRMRWDDLSMPAVDVPISYFFGGGGWKDQYSNKSLKNLLFGYNSDEHSFYCYFPMPYFEKASIEISNKSNMDIKALHYTIGVKPSSVVCYPKNQTGYFMAKLTKDSCYSGPKIIDSPKVYDKPYEVAFNETGYGHVEALNMFSGNYWEDGDEFTYIDGSNTPQIHGDGTEDDLNQGWAGGKFQKPLWGALDNGVKGSYRIHLNEPYIFYKDIEIRFENTFCKYRENNARARKASPDTVVQTEFMIWYYKANCLPVLHLTDSVDIGNTASEKQHRFKIIGQTRLDKLTDCYDGYESADNFLQGTDDGRAFNKSISFNVKIDPKNKGVRLRNKINRFKNGIQTANVYVDGKKIPQYWHILSYSDQIAKDTRSFDGWFESEYEIPQKYTKGKKQVNIRIEYVQAVKNELNAYYYWIFSYK